MKYRIIAFGASNSKNSINAKLARHTANSIEHAEIKFLDLNEFEMPIYSIDRENEQGIPQEAHLFRHQLTKADGIVISFAEHNGAYTAAFKNIYDWVSRIDNDVWQQKPMFLLT